VILVDDGSPDNCGQLCDEFAAKDERVRVIHQENQGVSAARNNALAVATGDWILCVDGDDWIEPNACQTIRDAIESNSCDVLVFKAFRDSGDDAEILDCGLGGKSVYDLGDVADKEYLYRRVMGVSVGGKSYAPVYYSWDKAYRREFLIQNGIKYPVGLPKSEDKVFICQCFEKATRLCHINDVFYHYRMNEGSVCHRYSPNMDKSRMMLAEILLPIAERMNDELAELKNDPSYRKVLDDYTRFIFGTITDVLYLRYYHKDNPDRRTRRRDALKFLKTEPFKSAIKNIPYSSLSKVSKIKKFLLKHGFVSTFCRVSMKMRNV
jgi:glycosyltransferase involved in cell wall biosynthesis